MAHPMWASALSITQQNALNILGNEIWEPRKNSSYIIVTDVRFTFKYKNSLDNKEQWAVCW